METLRDIEIDQHLIERDRKRFDYFLPNYLLGYLKGSKRVCSAGCGMAYDVEKLNELGFDTYGFDPGARTEVWKRHRSPEVQKKLFIAMAGGDNLKGLAKSFDYVYALEVIEHVGTENGAWKLEDDFFQQRVRFIESCLDLLKPNGRFLISTSNRLSPLDIGHGHHYHPITNWFSQKGIWLAVPWSRKNFVCSFTDIEKYVDATKYKGAYTMRALTTERYPSNARGKRRFLGGVLAMYLKIVNLPPFRTSFLNPLLVVEITLNGKNA